MIKAVSLGKKYDVKWVFRNLNFEAKRGDIVLVLGRNGAGKTTLLKILAGLEPFSEGSLIKQEIKKIGYLGHEHPFCLELTLKENMEFWLNLNRISLNSDLLESLLSSFQLLKFLNLKMRYFSSGMIKRADILRLFLINPDLYLMDEPTSGVDMDFFDLFGEEIKRLKDLGKIIFWVTHEKDKHIPFGNKLLEFKEKTAVLIQR